MTAFGVTPYGAVQVTSFHLPGYSESATAGSNQFALAYGSQTTTNVRTELGVRMDKAFVMSDGLFTLHSRLAWAHDSNTDRPVTAAFQSLPGATFTVNGARPAANSALATAGAAMKWRNGWSASRVSFPTARGPTPARARCDMHGSGAGGPVLRGRLRARSRSRFHISRVPPQTQLIERDAAGPRNNTTGVLDIPIA